MRIVGGEWGGRRIQAPPGRDTRPTSDRVREAWMSVLAAEIPGATVLDLFAGSGALGLEALSRGAVHATFVESASSTLAVLKRNVAALAAEPRSRVVRGDALRFARGLDPLAFDIAFADPPYGRGVARELAEEFLQKPFAAILAIEHRRDEPLPQAEDAHRRQYGDTVLTFLTADHER